VLKPKISMLYPQEALSTLDMKLRHMREDIAAIEARNNNLELQTRNSAKLLASLDGRHSTMLCWGICVRGRHENCVQTAGPFRGNASVVWQRGLPVTWLLLPVTSTAVETVRFQITRLQVASEPLTIPAVAGLLASLNLSTATQRVLGRAACDVSSIPQFADAGWELQRRLEDLQVSLKSVHSRWMKCIFAGRLDKVTLSDFGRLVHACRQSCSSMYMDGKKCRGWVDAVDSVGYVP
jgi:Exocyst complex component Sec3